MANDNFVNITQLDFAQIKSNFIEYLRSKQKFNGYDFEGSSLNILMDILAYNTHYMAFYASMVGNEMFLDSASRRDSIVSHAKLLNYLPRSQTSAKAIINLTKTSSGTINRGEYISGSYVNENNQAVTKIFTFLEDYEYEEYGVNDWRVNNASVYEGILQTLTYVHDTRKREHKFLVPADADVSTIRVKIRQSETAATDDTESWTRVTDFSQLGPDEKVFFVQAAYDGQYEVYFGDGILGANLGNGNIVYIEYLQNSGSAGNYFASFSKIGVSVSTVSSSIGGADPEDITDIRRNAPKAFVAQNRTVTSRDFESVIQTVYPRAESIKVWGGEENNPPQFGKVFVSIKPNAGLYLPSVEKETILEDLKSKTIVGIVPEIVDPQYLYAVVNINTTFDPTKTSLSRNEISALQKSKTLEYFDTVLEKFDTPFFGSKLNKILDEVDSAILGTRLETLVEQRIKPSTRYPTLVQLQFHNPVFNPYKGYKGSFRSSTFSYKNSVGATKTCFLEDDGNGKISIVSGSGEAKRSIVKEAGEIDYLTGNVTLFAFKPENYGTLDHIKVRVQPLTDDIFTMQNKIITSTSDSISAKAFTKEEIERLIRIGTSDFNAVLSAKNQIPEGPVVVQGGEAIRSPSPYITPNLPSLPPLPNSVPINIPTLGR